MDLLWRLGGAWLVGEAKLTWRVAAYVQLRRLYFPLLRGLDASPVVGVVLCKNLTRQTPRAEVAGSLAEAVALSRDGRMIPVLHLPLVG